MHQLIQQPDMVRLVFYSVFLVNVFMATLLGLDVTFLKFIRMYFCFNVHSMHVLIWLMNIAKLMGQLNGNLVLLLS